MLTESCVIFLCRPEPFKALFCEVIYRPVEREREERTCSPFSPLSMHTLESCFTNVRTNTTEPLPTFCTKRLIDDTMQQAIRKIDNPTNFTNNRPTDI